MPFMGVRAAVIRSIPLNGRHPSRRDARGGLMKKLLFAAIVSAAGFAVWRKVEAGKTGTQPWAAATDRV